MGSKTDYEPIPDVEKGEGDASASASSKYPDLDDQQTELLWNLDSAIDSAHLDLSLPQVDKSEMISQGQNFVRSMLMPTVTAIGTFVAALMLRVSAETNSISAILVQFFPYINATIIFFSSISPIQKRMMDSITPVFEKMDHAEDTVKETVAEIRPNVDSTVDALQVQVGEVLKPIKPTLDKASAQSSMLKKIHPDLDIPDSSDIDREFDEAQGIVGDKVTEAEKHISIKEHIPPYLQTPKSFYWRIVFPVVLLALFFQLALAFVTEYYFSPASTTSPSVPSRMILADQLGFDLSNLRGTNLRGSLFNVDDIPNDEGALAKVEMPGTDTEDYKEELSEKTDEVKEEIGQKTNEAKEELGEKTNEVKEEFSEKTNEVKEAIGEKAHEVEEKANEFEEKAGEQVEQFKEEFAGKEAEFRGQLDYALANSKSMMMNVALSYLMALLQLGLTYLLTNPAVKAWILNMIMKKLSNEAERSLREYGVSTALEDVLGTRMIRIRQKVLRLIRAQKKIEGVLEKAGVGGSLTASVAGASSAVSDLRDKVADVKAPSGLGRLFGSRKK